MDLSQRRVFYVEDVLIFVGVILFLSASCWRAGVVLGRKNGRVEMQPILMVNSDISPMSRRNATGVVCKFLIWGVDDVCMVLLSGQPLTVMSAGLLSSLVLIVVFLVVSDRSKRKVYVVCTHSSIFVVPSPKL